MVETTTREKLQDRILALAEAILEKDGLEALKARRLAHEAQCSVGTLYNAFKDLDDVIVRINERTLQHLDAAIATATAHTCEAELETRLLAVATAYLRYAIAHTSRWRAIAAYRLPEGSHLPLSYRERQVSVWRHVEVPLIPLIPNDDARRSTARAAFSAIHGTAEHALDRKNGEFDANEASYQINFLAAAIARHVMAR